MKDLQFPINFTFKISTLSNDFTAKDATGNTVAYVRQKLFKFKEEVNINDDESRSSIAYTIKANKWLDFSAAYSFKDKEGNEFGKIARKGWRSIWKAEYELIDENEQLQYHVREENGWVKVMDAIFSEIPIIGIFTGYVFNPSYIVTDTSGKEIVRLKKQPSLVGRRFTVDKLGEIDNDDDDRIMLGLMMMILLERRRG